MSWSSSAVTRHRTAGPLRARIPPPATLVAALFSPVPAGSLDAGGVGADDTLEMLNGVGVTGGLPDVRRSETTIGTAITGLSPFSSSSGVDNTREARWSFAPPTEPRLTVATAANARLFPDNDGARVRLAPPPIDNGLLHMG